MSRQPHLAVASSCPTGVSSVLSECRYPPQQHPTRVQAVSTTSFGLLCILFADLLQSCFLPTSRRWLRGEGVQDRTWGGLLAVLNKYCTSLAAEIGDVLGVERQPCSSWGKHKYTSSPCIMMSAAATLYRLHYCPSAVYDIVQVH